MNDIGDGHNVEIPRVFGPVHLDSMVPMVPMVPI